MDRIARLYPLQSTLRTKDGVELPFHATVAAAEVFEE